MIKSFFCSNITVSSQSLIREHSRFLICLQIEIFEPIASQKRCVIKLELSLVEELIFIACL